MVCKTYLFIEIFHALRFTGTFTRYNNGVLNMLLLLLCYFYFTTVMSEGDFLYSLRSFMVNSKRTFQRIKENVCIASALMYF